MIYHGSLLLLTVASLILYPTAGRLSMNREKRNHVDVFSNRMDETDRTDDDASIVSKTYYTQDQNADHNIKGAHPAGKESNWVADFVGVGSWLEWDVETPVCGMYTLTVRYQAVDRPVNLYVDGLLNGEVATVGTSWNVWNTVSTEVTLGCNGVESHMLRLKADNSKGPNIDTLTASYEVPNTASPTTFPTPPPVPTSSPAPTAIPTREAWDKGNVIVGGYNLILTNLRCWNSKLSWTADNYCPNLSTGIHLPDHNEKFVMIQAIIARMFTDEYLDSIYTKNVQFGVGGSCGQEAETPYYLAHNGVEHGRYYAKSRVECETPPPAHQTCPADCSLFGSGCQRMKAFREGSNGYIQSEAMCGDLKTCFKSSSHCGVIFNPDRNFFFHWDVSGCRTHYQWLANTSGCQ